MCQILQKAVSSFYSKHCPARCGWAAPRASRDRRTAVRLYEQPKDFAGFPQQPVRPAPRADWSQALTLFHTRCHAFDLVSRGLSFFFARSWFRVTFPKAREACGCSAGRGRATASGTTGSSVVPCDTLSFHFKAPQMILWALESGGMFCVPG